MRRWDRRTVEARIFKFRCKEDLCVLGNRSGGWIPHVEAVVGVDEATELLDGHQLGVWLRWRTGLIALWDLGGLLRLRRLCARRGGDREATNQRCGERCFLHSALLQVDAGSKRGSVETDPISSLFIMRKSNRTFPGVLQV